jgi:glycosyltransferase involved in cell wall biosynthesis
MEKELPFVSAIVPCLNEERFISACLDSIIANDYPKDRMEILVVDGGSSDKTKDIIKIYASKNSYLKLLDNPRKITPAAMNVGIKNSKGEIIIKMDAHSLYQKDYISKCVSHMLESGAENVGGILKTIPFANDLPSEAIAICLSHPFGAGMSDFRTGSGGPQKTDAVAFGCYKKKTLESVGGFNENLAKTEDLELNSRIKKAGGEIMLFPDIVAYYYPTSNTLKKFFRHNFSDGFWLTYPIKFNFFALSLKRLIPAFFVFFLSAFLLLSPLSFLARLFVDFILGSYLFLSLLFSAQIAVRKGAKYFFAMPAVFVCRHVGYGAGSLWGLLKILK